VERGSEPKPFAIRQRIKAAESQLRMELGVERHEVHPTRALDSSGKSSNEQQVSNVPVFKDSSPLTGAGAWHNNV